MSKIQLTRRRAKRTPAYRQLLEPVGYIPRVRGQKNAQFKKIEEPRVVRAFRGRSSNSPPERRTPRAARRRCTAAARCRSPDFCYRSLEDRCAGPSAAVKCSAGGGYEALGDRSVPRGL